MDIEIYVEVEPACMPFSHANCNRASVYSALEVVRGDNGMLMNPFASSFTTTVMLPMLLSDGV